MRYGHFFGLLEDRLTPARCCFVHQAIVLCLDLSESMNKRSGVSHSKAGRESPAENHFNHESESFDLLDVLAKDVPEDVILEHGRILFGVLS